MALTGVHHETAWIAWEGSRIHGTEGKCIGTVQRRLEIRLIEITSSEDSILQKR